MEIRLSKLHKTKIEVHADVYEIMRMVLQREQKIDRNREHLWVIGLAADNTILLVELVSMGSVTRTIAEPMEIFSLALQKRCVKIILVHNHPSGSLKPSVADKDTTDRMIQVGRIVDVPVLDHCIISDQGYFSFAEDGLMDDLSKSLKYVAPYELMARGRQLGKEKTGSGRTGAGSPDRAPDEGQRVCDHRDHGADGA
ncbi:JAB domain-containing protein [Chitinophaga sedimenti]|uniref:JAB domain-containing protein n=1 Tax=Chitinophaga sedimenti TaxID=2033606 RepID=UPI0020029EDD|nr:JAB domain-containing protein [Chitinophaga sedimenti]MCK7560215.1 JAB domain-containing protein [Chitinophaga sedimenti]